MNIVTVTTRGELPVPQTVRHLRTLGPGERLIYYRGNFDFDIARCKPSGGDSVGAPLYCHVLQTIRKTAGELELLGKVTLSQGIVSLTDGQRLYIEYIATGQKR